MSFIHNKGRHHKNLFGLDGKDLVCILVKTGSSAATERSNAFIDDYSDLQEYDGVGYDRQVILAADWTLTENDTDNRDELTFDNPVTFASVAAAGANAIGMVVGVILGDDEDDDADNIALAYINTSPAFPRNGDGGDIVFTGASLGVLRFGG